MYSIYFKTARNQERKFYNWDSGWRLQQDVFKPVYICML